MALHYFITRTAGEQPKQYEGRVAELLEDLAERGIEWSEEPALRGCYLLSANLEPIGTPFAYLEYPK